MSENEFSELVQGLSPYSDFSDIEQYVLNYREGDIVSGVSIDIPAEIHTNERVSETVFRDNYKNRKSNAGVDIYWVYYNLLFDYLENPSSATIDKLLTFFENNKAMLNKAFGCGQNIFTQKTGDRPTTIEFDKQYKKMFEGNLNIYIFKQFSLSKILDQIREYSDTTKRIFKANWIASIIDKSNIKAATGYETAVQTWIDTYEGNNKIQYDKNGFLVMPDYTKL